MDAADGDFLNRQLERDLSGLALARAGGGSHSKEKPLLENSDRANSMRGAVNCRKDAGSRSGGDGCCTFGAGPCCDKRAGCLWR